MRAHLPQRELEILRHWEAIGLYRLVQQRTADRRPFLLRDGPPFCHSGIHLDHALNKILKDIIVKFRSMQGYDVPFVPGWDAHGLPVEIQAVRAFSVARGAIPPRELRRDCARLARKYSEHQRDQFKRLGIRGDWAHPITTTDPSYQAAVLETFRRLVEAKAVYRDMLPVWWCPTCETALADAELEYADRDAHDAHIAFPVLSLPAGVLPKADSSRLSVVVRATALWMLPAGVGVGVNADADYALVTDEDDTEGFTYLVARTGMDAFARAAGMRRPCVVSTLAGQALVGSTLRHPLLARELPLIPAPAAEGTGFALLVPGHRVEDLAISRAHGLPIVQPVDSTGNYDRDAGLVAGLSLAAGEEAMLARMDRDGTLLAYRTTTQPVPHCWRCHDPAVRRALPQWFLATAPLVARARAMLNQVSWLPAWGRARLDALLAGRPDWCLSRQHVWGTPIPAFTCTACRTPLLTAVAIAHVQAIIAREGADAWYRRPAAELLPPETRCDRCGGTTFRTGTDVFDVWFDSACSHLAAPEEERTADLLVEGQDQYRGWFHLSLLAGVGSGAAQAPYRAVFSHGFVRDRLCLAASPAQRTDPLGIVLHHGADVLRLWAAAADARGDVALSDTALRQAIAAYRRLRNTARFLLGNLFDFTPALVQPAAALAESDRWALHRLAECVDTMAAAYDGYAFPRAVRAVTALCAELSAVYFSVAKERLYLPATGDPARRAAQTTCYHLVVTLAQVLAPLVSFTADDIWQHLPTGDRPPSAQLTDWPAVAGWRDTALAARWTHLLALRREVAAAVRVACRAHEISRPAAAKVLLYSAGETLGLLESFGDTLVTAFAVSAIELAPWDDAPADAVRSALPKLAMRIVPAAGVSCPRCRHWREIMDRVSGLCARCHAAVHTTHSAE